MKKLSRVYLLLILTFISSISLAWGATLVEQRPDIQSFIAFMDAEYGYDPAELTAMFNTIKAVPTSALAYNQRPAIHQMQGKHDFVPWCDYRKIFLTEDQISNGAKYWAKNRRWLEKASKIYGVPPQIIVATIGVETKYGARMGNYPVFKTLAVLAFDYPPRKLYFKKELIAFLLYCRKNHLETLEIQGSYAGAIGQPQFMPSNIRRYAVDFDEKGSIDLIHDDADAIGSVAHYYHANHWKTGGLVAKKTKIDPSKINELSKNVQKRAVSLDLLRRFRVYFSGRVGKKERVSLIKLSGCQGPEYWLTFYNFNVLKSYNNSTDYAMALFQLSEKIATRYRKQYT